MHEQVIHRHDKLDHNMPPALFALNLITMIQSYKMFCFVQKKKKTIQQNGHNSQKKDKDFIVNC